jgi:hypothetical protein
MCWLIVNSYKLFEYTGLELLGLPASASQVASITGMATTPSYILSSLFFAMLGMESQGLAHARH